ncbi:MAG: dolichyl-phosphate beta-glucosyltransferase [Patescibacteria group bacterium]
MAKIKLSVVVPCYNEESRVRNGFNHYYSYLKKQKYSWELIFVDDGSHDRTLDLIKKTAKGKRNIKVIHYSKNRGKGYAIIRGVKSAKGDYILFSDVDHSVSINTIESFYKYFDEGFDVVIGSRRVKGAKILVHQKPLRELLGSGFTLLVRLAIDFKIRDVTCGFKAFKKEVAEKIFNKLTVFGWAFDAEIIYICKKLGYKIAQAPVSWSDVRGTKVNLKKDILRSLSGLVKIRVNDSLSKYG